MKGNWFPMKKRAIWLLLWYVFSFVLLFGPLAGSGEAGTVSPLFVIEAMFLILVPLVTIMILAGDDGYDTNVDAGVKGDGMNETY